MVSLVTLALVAAAQLPPPPPSQAPLPPRDNVSAPRAPTGVIRGQVTARDTGQLIARAAVVLTSRALRRAPGEGPMQTRTDADGRYEFTGPQRTRPLRDYYERLAAIADRFTLNKGEERVLQLHVRKLQ